MRHNHLGRRKRKRKIQTQRFNGDLGEKIDGARKIEGKYQNYVLVLDIHFQVRRNSRSTIRLSTNTVRFDPNKVESDWKIDATDQVSQEDEGSSGDADDDRRRRGFREVGRDLGGEVGDSRRNLVLVPEHSLNVRMECHERR